MKELHLKSVNDVFSFAIEREKLASQMYETASKKVTNLVLKSTLLDLSREELKHQTILELVAQKYTNAIVPTQIVSIDFDEYSFDKKIFEVEDVKEIFDYAIHMENKSVDLYESMAQQVIDKDIKALLMELVKQESSHEHQFEFYADNIEND